MFAGHWQLLILLGIFVFLFGPKLLRLLRRFGGNGVGSASAGASRAVDGRRVKCPHCGAENPGKARFCCECGKPMEFIDV